jgi:hypothetical protein
MEFNIIIGVVVAILLLPGVIVLLFSYLRYLRYPEKSFYNSFINVVLIPVRLLKMKPFNQGKITIEKSMKYAIKKTGLTEFGDTNFLKAYDALCNGPIHKQLKLTNIGYIGHRIELNMTMVRRLKHLHYLKQNPDVLQVPVRAPVFVLGLPRTGTTFLHRLLSLDPAVRPPLLWELLAYVPSVPGESDPNAMIHDNEIRAKYVRKLIKMRKDMGDHAIDHIHETDADSPEECIWAMTDELPLHMSFLYSIYCDYDRFLSEFPKENFERAYHYYKTVLQVLSYQANERGSNNNKNPQIPGKEPRRWMLKSPMHLFLVKQLAAAFPDAKIVWTHRHPVSAVPSMCSLIKSLHQMYYENESRDDAIIGREIAKVSAAGLSDCSKDIIEANLDSVNITYEIFVKDPIATVKGIYQHFNWTFTKQYEQILLEFLATDAKKRELKKKEQKAATLHAYTPEEYHLTSDELSTGVFQTYVEKFNIPMSRN